MLQLTKRTEYGLIALVHLVDREGEYVSVREICERYPVPRRLLAEVLKELGRAELVASHRGSTGGYALARAPEDITLSEVVTALRSNRAEGAIYFAFLSSCIRRSTSPSSGGRSPATVPATIEWAVSK
jgi:Rrf2 family protein